MFWSLMLHEMNDCMSCCAPTCLFSLSLSLTFVVFLPLICLAFYSFSFLRFEMTRIIYEGYCTNKPSMNWFSSFDLSRHVEFTTHIYEHMAWVRKLLLALPLICKKKKMTYLWALNWFITSYTYLCSIHI